MAAPPLQHDIDYPESDGRPLWESDWHHEAISYLLHAFKWHFHNAPEVYVSGTLLIYYVEGDPSAMVCPDVFVVKGVPKGPRRTYRLWEERQPPVLVIEVTSASTRYEDTVEKKEKYARLGVEEYFLFDPLDEYLSPQLQGFRLAGERYWPIELENDGSLNSRVTGLRFEVENGQRLRLVDLATGRPLPRTEEEAVARRIAETARRIAETARQVAERRADEETVARQAAEAARRAAEERAEAAEEEIARLRRELAKRQA
jgi:Uma2 family endonuclease